MDTETLTNAVCLAQRLVHGRRASLMLPVTSAADELQVVAASGLPATIMAQARVRIGEPISGLVAQRREPLLVNDPSPHLGLRVNGYETPSFISVPVRLDDDRVGVLNVADPLAGHHFREDDVAVLRAYAEQLGDSAALVTTRWEVRQLKDTVQQLRREIIEAQEVEQQRLARDLHDEAGQMITAAIFRLDLARTKLPPGSDTSQVIIDQARDSLMDCAATLHTLAFALRPRILEDLGMNAALRSLIKQMEEAGLPPATLAIEDESRRLRQEIELVIFRVVQEALTNIRKHAHARSVAVSLRFLSGWLVLTIEDDGVGLQQPHAHSSGVRPSLGLIGMRERVEAFGGTFSCEPRPACGTRLSVLLPL